jgi:hypothetical protein
MPACAGMTNQKIFLPWLRLRIYFHARITLASLAY